MKCILLLSIIIAICVTGEALKCYSGRLYDKSFDGKNVATKDCAAGLICQKFTVHLTNNSLHTFRDCATKVPYPDIYVAREPNVTADELGAYYCNTDLCNDARSISPNYIIIFSIPITIISSYKSLY